LYVAYLQQMLHLYVQQLWQAQMALQMDPTNASYATQLQALQNAVQQVMAQLSLVGVPTDFTEIQHRLQEHIQQQQQQQYQHQYQQQYQQQLQAYITSQGRPGTSAAPLASPTEAYGRPNIPSVSLNRKKVRVEGCRDSSFAR
jgi:hypothetical protein